MTNKFIRDVKEVIRRLRNRGISFDGNRQYPAIPTIDNSVESHTNALRAIREAIETHERRNSKASLDSFVRLYELEDVLGGFEGGDTGAFGVDNVGSGAKVHKVTESVGGVPTAKLRSIISSDGTITITQLANEIDLSVAGGMAGFPDTIIADTAAELCSNRVGGTPVTLTYTPAVDTPNATEGHFALIVTYFQGDLVGGDGGTTVTGLTGWTQVVGSGSHMFVVHYKFLTVDDLNTTFTYTLDAVGIKKGCRVVYIVQNVNTEAPFYSFTSDYYLHGNRRANKTWSTMGAAVPSAAFATGQHAFTITHSRDYNAAADAWSDMGLVELGETSTWADLHVTEKSFPYLSSDIPCMQFRVVGRKANVSRDENLIPGETELSSMQDASWNTNGVLITRPNTYYTSIEATGAGVIQHHAEQTLELTAGEKVTFAVWFREESSYPNSTRKVLMYTVDPSNNERGVFLTKDGTPRNLYVSEFLDTQSDRNTNWRYLAYKSDNDGNPSVDGMVLVLYLIAPTTGTYKFRFCPAYYSGGTSSSYAAASGKLYVMHAGLRKGWHSPRKIWTPNGPVSNSAVMGVIDNPGYLLNTGDQGNNPFESQQFTMVLNPSWIKYPKAQFVPYLANVDSTGQGVVVSGETYTVPNGNVLTSDDFVNMYATPKYVHPTLNGSAGKYYWEARCDVVTDAGWTSYQMVGIVPPFSAWASDWNTNNYPGIWYDPYLNGDGGLAVNDVIGVAMDFDAGQVKFYRNNVLKKTSAMDKTIPWAAFVAAPPAYMRPLGQWTVRMRGPFTYDPPTGFVEYDITGDPNFSFGTNTVNVGGGAEILIPGDPDTYRTLLSGAGISVTQEATAIRIAQNIPQLPLMGAGNLSKTADTLAAYDQSATAHKRVTPQEIVASTSLDDLGDVNTSGATSGKFLKFNGTAWVPDTAGSPTTTLGDLIRRGASADERLPIGTNGQVLTVVSGQPAWAAPTGGSGGSSGGGAVGLSYRAAQYPPVESLIPPMTSNTTPSGVMSASSTEPTTSAWSTARARGEVGGWVTNNTGIGSGQWIKYQFTSAKIVKSYSIIPWTYDLFPSRYISAWKLQGSNDDINWTDIDSRTKTYTNWAFGAYHYFSCPSNNTAYTYYRLFITGNGGNSYVGITRWELYDVDVDPGDSIVVGQSIQHVDAPPAVADSMDDEFEGTTLSSKWSWRNQGSATAVLSNGCLVLTAPASSGNNMRIIEQSVSDNWKYRAKISAQLFANYSCAGIAVMRTASGKIVRLNKVHDTGTGTESFSVNRMDGVATFNTTFFADDIIDKYGAHQQFLYMEIEHDGTNIVFRISGNGVDFTQYYAETTAAFLGGAPDKIQLFAESNNSSSKAAVLVCDWFRKIGTSYAPGKFAVNAQLEPSTVAKSPDTKPSTPNAIDDEFEGTSLDSKWTFYSGNSSGITFRQGCLVGTNAGFWIEQPISGNFRVAAKLWCGKWFTANNQGIAMYVKRSANGAAYDWGMYRDGAGSNKWVVDRLNNGPAWVAQDWTSVMSDPWLFALQPWYVEIEYDGTNLYFRRSLTGHIDGFHQEWSVPVANHLGGAPDRVGITMSAHPGGLIDWFRRLA